MKKNDHKKLDSLEYPIIKNDAEPPLVNLNDFKNPNKELGTETTTQDPSYLMNTYHKTNVYFERGKGTWLWDNNGKRYLDAVSGLAVNNLGHCHPKISTLIKEQTDKLMHVSNLYHIKKQEQLAKTLCQTTAMEKVFFCNSGAEANEAAIKITRLYGNKRGYKHPIIISMRNCFHGRTMANISQYFHNSVSEKFAPLLPGFISVPFDDLKELECAIKHHSEVVAVFMEPIQGEAGVILPQKNHLEKIRKLCDHYKILMILDEVQTGMGRTGKMFAFQHEGLIPDIITIAKGLANGFPIGACLAKGEAANLFKPGMHGSTFGGNPLASAIGLEVCNIMSQSGFYEQVTKIGKYLLDQLRQHLIHFECIQSIHGIGLMIGIHFNENCAILKEIALDLGLLINIMHGHIIRIVPALIISKIECDQLVFILQQTIKSWVMMKKN